MSHRPFVQDGKTVFPKEYAAWVNMRARCLRTAHKAYPYYGGRGISICDEWSDFEVFYDWCQIAGIEDALTLDRKDNDGNYCPENCRWVNWSVQRNNQSNVKWLTFEGETLNQTEWAKRIGIKDCSLLYRLKNWNLEKALTTPSNKL